MKKSCHLFWLLIVCPLLPLTAQSGQIGSVPGEIYTGIGQTFTTEFYLDTGGMNVAFFRIDFTYNYKVIRPLEVTSGDSHFELVVGMGNGKYTVTSFNPIGVGPFFNLHFLSLLWQATRRGASYITINPAEITDDSYKSLSVAAPAPIIVHVAREGELWGTLKGFLITGCIMVKEY